jgi:alpha-galactosidase
VDRSRFPNGLREISDFAHSQGVNALLWFEPERVTAGTWLTENHPDWILGGAAGGLLDLGNPEAWEWLVNHVDRILVDEGIDLYRQDYNIEPLPHWLAADSDERRGLTENFYVQGYLAYWDELLRRHPGMLIDSCASGGHRNDLETMRRSVPLLRSDYFHTPITNQCQTYGLASWLPYYGTAIVMGPLTPYAYRSFMCPHNTACFDMRNPDIDYELARSLVEQWHRIAPYYLEDYYPLLPYDTAEDVWMAWQFHNPDTDSGVVQGFRRTGSVFYGAHLSLRGLHAHHTYRFEDLDGAPAITLTGAEAEAGGLPLEIPERPGAVVIHYRALETQE